MQNTRLQLLLERAPISDEDRSNISRIFAVLSEARKIAFMNEWDEYIVRFVSIKQCLQEEECRRFLEGLRAVDMLLDESILRQEEQNLQKEQKKQAIREQLESTVAYGQMQKLRKIKELQKTPA